MRRSMRLHGLEDGSGETAFSDTGTFAMELPEA
jgi:hypothetical protein